MGKGTWIVTHLSSGSGRNPQLIGHFQEQLSKGKMYSEWCFAGSCMSRVSTLWYPCRKHMVFYSIRLIASTQDPRNTTPAFIHNAEERIWKRRLCLCCQLVWFWWDLNSRREKKKSHQILIKLNGTKLQLRANIYPDVHGVGCLGRHPDVCLMDRVCLRENAGGVNHVRVWKNVQL